jgi:hypothetical protein
MTEPTWPAELLAYIDGIRASFNSREEADDYLKVGLMKKWGPLRDAAPQLAEAEEAIQVIAAWMRPFSDREREVEEAFGQLRDALEALAAQGASARAVAPQAGSDSTASHPPVDAFPALHALTEAVLTRADNDYMARRIDEAVQVMASRGWTPPVPWPDPEFFATKTAPGRDSTPPASHPEAQPAEQRKPLTEAQLARCIGEAGCYGKVTMSFDSGPYEITRPSINATRLCQAIERAHGITEQRKPE